MRHIGYRLSLIVVVLLAAVLPGSRLSAGDPPRNVPFDSLVDLVMAVRVQDRQDVVDRYMEDRGADGFPVVEDSLVHFIFRSKQASSVSVPGDFNGWDKDHDFMHNLEGTDLFYLTKSFERDARLDYKFVVDGQRWILDPLNPATVTGGFGPNSEVALPAYIQPEEILFREDISHGAIERFTFESALCGNSRQIQVYLPPGYEDDESATWPVLYVHDGGEYVSLGSMDRVLDLLISRGDIRGVIVVFVDPVDRNGEYRLSDIFERMFVEEIVPMIDGRYRTIADPGGRGMMGASLGGLISVHIVSRNPGLFGLCGSQSGAFFPENDRVIRSLPEAPGPDMVFYLDWGTYEPMIQASNRRMLDVMDAGGYKVSAFEYHEGHSWGSWRAHVDDLLRTLYGEGQ